MLDIWLACYLRGGCKQQQEVICDVTVWANACLRHQRSPKSQDPKNKLVFSQSKHALTMQVAPTKTILFYLHNTEI